MVSHCSGCGSLKLPTGGGCGLDFDLRLYNITVYNPNMHRYAVFTACCTFLLLIAGALVTSNDAGLSIPDWPWPTAL